MRGDWKLRTIPLVIVRYIDYKSVFYRLPVKKPVGENIVFRIDASGY